MKKLQIGFVSAMMTVAAIAGVDNITLTFSTQGPDTYDGKTVVQDGECYALCWTKAGSEFVGIAADGTAVDADNNAVVLVAPVAKDGHCPTVFFQIDSAVASQYDGGEFEIYLLDTRVIGKDGSYNVGGLASNGKPVAINGFGKVATAAAAKGAPAVADGDQAAIETASAAPANAPAPRIKAMKVIGGKVFLTVENTLPCLQYNVAGGETVQDISGKKAEAPANGKAGEDIILVAPVENGSAFFKVIRN